MSVNFGYGGYGMNMGMNPIQNQQNINNSNPYNCRVCDVNGVVPYNHKTFVNPIPRVSANPTFLDRLICRLMGG